MTRNRLAAPVGLIHCLYIGVPRKLHQFPVCFFGNVVCKAKLAHFCQVGIDDTLIGSDIACNSACEEEYEATKGETRGDEMNRLKDAQPVLDRTQYYPAPLEVPSNPNHSGLPITPVSGSNVKNC